MEEATGTALSELCSDACDDGWGMDCVWSIFGDDLSSACAGKLERNVMNTRVHRRLMPIKTVDETDQEHELGPQAEQPWVDNVAKVAFGAKHMQDKLMSLDRKDPDTRLEGEGGHRMATKDINYFIGLLQDAHDAGGVEAANTRLEGEGGRRMDASAAGGVDAASAQTELQCSEHARCASPGSDAKSDVLQAYHAKGSVRYAAASLTDAETFKAWCDAAGYAWGADRYFSS